MCGIFLVQYGNEDMRMKYMAINIKICDITSILSRFVIFLALPLMVSLTFMQVILRYVFGSPTTWSEELVMFLFIWLVLIGSSYAYRDGKHIIIDVFIRRLDIKLQYIIHLISEMAVLATSMIFVFSGFRMALVAKSSVSAALRISMFYIYLAVPVCCILILLYSIENTMVTLNKLKNIMGKH